MFFQPKSQLQLAIGGVMAAVGAWHIATQRAVFDLGGDDLHNSHVVHVNAHGWDAIAIGVFTIALATINTAVCIRDDARIAVMWAGLALFAAATLYGIVSVFM